VAVIFLESGGGYFLESGGGYFFRKRWRLFF
jgi:hypothetical protein